MKCVELFYTGLGRERKCNRKATYWLDGKRPICERCARACHPRRLTRINK